jgi:hypothetical protein
MLGTGACGIGCWAARSPQRAGMGAGAAAKFITKGRLRGDSFSSAMDSLSAAIRTRDEEIGAVGGLVLERRIPLACITSPGKHVEQNATGEPTSQQICTRRGWPPGQALCDLSVSGSRCRI